MRSKAQSDVIEFCLEYAESAPVAKRISLYRGLAEICGDAQEGAQLQRIAHDLELADQKCREFAFHFANPAPVLPKKNHTGDGNGRSKGTNEG